MQYLQEIADRDLKKKLACLLDIEMIRLDEKLSGFVKPLCWLVLEIFIVNHIKNLSFKLKRLENAVCLENHLI